MVLGSLHDPFSLFFRLFGRRTARTPMEYCRIDPVTGLVTHNPLVNTNENVHACVRFRQVHGPGVLSAPTYATMAHQGWQLSQQSSLQVTSPFNLAHTTVPEINNRQMRYFWQKRMPNEKVLEMEEDKLGDIEVNYLKQFARDITAPDPGFP